MTPSRIDPGSARRLRHGRTTLHALSLGAAALLGSLVTLPGQPTNFPRPGFQLTPPPTIQIRPAPPPVIPVQPAPPPTIHVHPAQPAPASDPLMNLMLQQPPIDTESPVIAEAEFDPPIVPVGGRATYRIVLTAMSESIQAPETLPIPPGLDVAPGGRGQAYAFLGQKMQARTTLNYRVLAKAIGTHTIPPFSVTVNSKLVQVPGARISVVSPEAAPAPLAPRLEIKLPGDEFYVGQAIPARIMLLDPGDGSVRGLTQAQVTSEAFVAETSFYRHRQEMVMRDGRPVPAFIQETFITPIKEGEHTLTAHAQGILTRPPTNLLSRLPGYNPLIDADPITVIVKHLPKEGELPGFTGAIGMFQLEPPKLSAAAVRAGDPVTLMVTVKGDGNLARLIPPKLERARDWQTFPPLADMAPVAAILQRGACNFTYTLIPLSDRCKATPPIPFSYFEPTRKVYVDLTVPPVPITVEPAPPGAVLQPTVMAAPSGFGPDDGLERERDLVMTGLEEKPGLMASSLVPVQQRWWFIGCQLVPILALGGLWGWDRRQRYLAQHPEVVLRSRARRGLRRYRRLLRRAALEQDALGFVKAAIHALREACAPHAAANPEALVCGDILREIPNSEHQAGIGNLVRRIFAAADYVQFGGTQPDGAQILKSQRELELLLKQLKGRL